MKIRLGKIKNIHFVGIGGIGMGTLASLLIAKGCRVSGSDVRSNSMTEKLSADGATIFQGHHQDHIAEAKFVIYSTAIVKDNPELLAAQNQDKILYRRAEFLAYLMQGYTTVTVAGAHGKTTTSSMIAQLLMDAGCEPTVALGGVIKETTTSSRLGKGTYFVAELDESDGTFLKFSPIYSVITNIDLEHIDFYQNWDNVIKAYRQFIDQTDPQGTLIAYGEDERLITLLMESNHAFLSYGFSASNDVIAHNIQYTDQGTLFECRIKGKNLGTIVLNVPGDFNIANALATITVGWLLDIDFSMMQKMFKSYRGVKRRFHIKGCVNQITVIDDYAHHPTELKSTLKAARDLKPGRIISIFQPHRYSRLQALMQDFAQSLSNSDYIIVTDVYAASEKVIEGADAQSLVKHISASCSLPVIYLPKEEIISHVLTVAQPQDFVMTLGAGDVTTLSDDLVDALKAKDE